MKMLTTQTVKQLTS